MGAGLIRGEGQRPRSRRGSAPGCAGSQLPQCPLPVTVAARCALPARIRRMPLTEAGPARRGLLSVLPTRGRRRAPAGPRATQIPARPTAATAAGGCQCGPSPDRDLRLAAAPRMRQPEGRARNPRWEPGMGMIPDSRQIGDGGGGGPPIPGKSGMAVGMDPRSPANRGSGVGRDPRL